MNRKEISLDLEDVRTEIIYHQFKDTGVKTFLLSFPTQRKILSTLEGFKRVKFVGNHYNPPQLWDFIHKNKEKYRRWIFASLGIKLKETAMLYTGVDMDNIFIKIENFQDIKICICVTAGVKSNAQRIGVDKASSVEIKEGEFESLGTINIIVLTNASLTDGAIVRSIITLTEAKTQALQDLDIRSSYNPNLQATGTGTDNVIVVSGFGTKITYVGGHAKIGEIMAKTTTLSVKEAILKKVEIKDEKKNSTGNFC
ncbi:MAG: adenosylcobinamide amidohydrolase [Nitrospirota bacterium]